MIIHIHDATTLDAQGIARIRVETWRATYQGIIPAEVLAALDVEEETRVWRERLETLSPGRSYIMADVLSEPLENAFQDSGLQESKEPIHASRSLPSSDRGAPGREPAVPATELSTRDPAGYCMCGPAFEADPDYPCEIYALYVHPRYQHQGIGRALMETALAWLHGQRCGKVILYVLRDNLPARRFYESMGGTQVRERMADIRGTLLAEVGYGYNL